MLKLLRYPQAKNLHMYISLQIEKIIQLSDEMAPNVAKVCNETFKSAFSTSFAVTNELFTTPSKQYDDINLEGEEEATEETQAAKKSSSVSLIHFILCTLYMSL